MHMAYSEANLGTSIYKHLIANTQANAVVHAAYFQGGVRLVYNTAFYSDLQDFVPARRLRDMTEFRQLESVCRHHILRLYD